MFAMQQYGRGLSFAATPVLWAERLVKDSWHDIFTISEGGKRLQQI